jgi:protein TonB
MKSLISLSILSICFVACQPSKAPEQKQTSNSTTEDTARIDSIVLKTQPYLPPPPPTPAPKYLEFVAPTLDPRDMPEDEHMDIHTEGTQGQYADVGMEAGDRTYNHAVSYEYVEQKPEFNPKGGYDAYIKENLIYPAAASDDGIEGTCIISFTVAKDGQIIFAGIAKSSGYRELDYEALRVIKKMPRWTPGKVNGQPVPVMHSISVVFEMRE